MEPCEVAKARLKSAGARFDLTKRSDFTVCGPETGQVDRGAAGLETGLHLGK